MTTEPNAYDLYSTHQEALIKAIAETDGAIVEFGCGYYSTPLLHSLDRFVVSLESRKLWFEKFKHYDCKNHRVILLNNWDDFYNLYPSPKWGLAFIDHEPTERRLVELQKLSGLADVIVCHDSETYPEDAFNGFEVELFDTQKPNTVILKRINKLI
jgi:hypothetical protein